MSSPLKIEWSQCAENTITPQVWGLWRSYAASGISQAHDLNPYSDIHTLLDAFHIISPRVGGS